MIPRRDIDPSPADRGRTGRQLDAVKYWMILVPLVAGAIIAWQAHRVLPMKFFLDESIITRFVSGELVVDGFSSYGTTGWLYRVTGLGSIPDLFPVLSYAVFAVTVFAAITWRGIPAMSIPALALAAGSLLLGSVYLSQYSKEFFVLPLVLMLLRARSSIGWEVAWIAAAVLYAVFVRQYWFLVVALYLGFRILMPRMHRIWMVVATIMIGFGVMIVVFQLAFGAPLTFYRTDINIALDFDRSTQIDDVITGSSFLAQWANAAAIMFLLAFPIPLLVSGNAVQLLAGGFIAVCWAFLAVRARHAIGQRGPALIPLAFLLSFLMVQTAFEPDFGSYLRHITPQLALFLALFSATSRTAASRTAEGEERSPAPGRHRITGSGRARRRPTKTAS